MGRILAIDYGKKRVGLAVTDSSQIIATALTTVEAKEIFNYLKQYCQKEEVESFLVGEAKRMDNTLSESAVYIEPFVIKLSEIFPLIPIIRLDERFTSKMAFQTMIESGISKKARRDKALVDKIAATILLQSYLQTKR